MKSTIIQMNHHLKQTSGTSWTCLRLCHYPGKVRRNFPYHSHDYYEVSFTFHGSNQLNINGELYPFHSGDLCVVTPETIHGVALPNDALIDIMEEADDVWEINLQIAADKQGLPVEDHCAYIVSMGKYTEYLKEALPILCKYMQEHNALDNLHLTLFQSIYEIVYELLNDDNCKKIADTSDAYVRKILLFIYQHFQENITLDYLVDRFAISKSHMLRLFKHYYQISPISYRIELQISAACNLLLGQDKSIACIAEELGFENVSYFIYAFSQRMHITPQKFRQKYANRFFDLR